MLSVLLSLALVQEIPSRVRTPEPPPPPPPPTQDENADLDAAMKALLDAQDAIVERKPAPPAQDDAPAKTADLDAGMRALLDAQDAMAERKPAPSHVEVPAPPAPPPAPVQDDNADPAPSSAEGLDAAAAALRDAQEAIREKRRREPKPLGTVPDAPTSETLLKNLVDAVKDQPPIPPTPAVTDPTTAGEKIGPSPEEVLSMRARQDAQRAKAEAEAMRLLADARVRRADQLSAMFADASRPLELPLSVEALPPIKDLRNYPLYIPRHGFHSHNELNLARTEETDILYYEHRAYIAHEREMMDEWTGSRRESAAAESKGFEEAWADQILQVKSALRR